MQPADSSLTLYHNSACSKCRKTLQILQESNLAFKTVEYLKTPLTAPQIKSLLTQLNLQPEQIVRKGEDEYTELEAQGQLPTTSDGWIELMIKHPLLIERPIVTDGKTGVIGRPPENVSTWLKGRTR